MNKNTIKWRAKNTNPILEAYAVNKELNIEDLRKWMEQRKDTFTDHFMVDNDQLIHLNKGREASQGNYTVQDNDVIVRDENGSYSVVTTEEFSRKYEECEEEGQKELTGHQE